MKFKMHSNLVLFYFTALIIFTGCEKEIVYDLLKGDLFGEVSLYDTNNGRIDDCSGVTVTLEGSDPEISVQTDADGKFIFEGIQSGTYNLLITKTGYSSYYHYGQRFLGGGKPERAVPFRLYQKTPVMADELTLTAEVNYNFVRLSGVCDASNMPEGRYSRFRYYLSDSPDVSWRNYRHTSIAASSQSPFYLYDLNDFLKYYPEGSDLYAIIYPCVEENLYYLDMDTGNLIYTTVNSENGSNVAHVVIPETEPFPY